MTKVIDPFAAASRSGDMGALGALLAADVGMWADGGGKRSASDRPVLGFQLYIRSPPPKPT